MSNEARREASDLSEPDTADRQRQLLENLAPYCKSFSIGHEIHQPDPALLPTDELRFETRRTHVSLVGGWYVGFDGVWLAPADDPQRAVARIAFLFGVPEAWIGEGRSA